MNVTLDFHNVVSIESIPFMTSKNRAKVIFLNLLTGFITDCIKPYAKNELQKTLYPYFKELARFQHLRITMTYNLSYKRFNFIILYISYRLYHITHLYGKVYMI